MKKKTTYPPGWDEARVQEVLAYDEGQSEAAFAEEPHTLVEVPTDLVPTIRELVAKHRKQRQPRHTR